MASYDENSLKSNFDKAENIVWSLESGNYKSDNQLQEMLLNAKEMLEEATKMVSELGLFSSNESLDDISSSDIRYLLLPAYLGFITLQLNIYDRKQIVNIAEAYFMDYIKRCQSYEIVDDGMVEERTRSACNAKVQNNAADLTRQREQKISRYRKCKERQNEIDSLRLSLAKSHIDDDVKRDYYKLIIDSWVDKSFNEIAALKLEKKFLEMRKDGSIPQRNDTAPSKPLKPIIITKNDLQKKVFGAGYASIPTVTVEEFFEQEVKKGRLPDQFPSSNSGGADSSNKSNDEDENVDDSEALNKQRQKDDWKDDHRRGWGNKKNRS